MKQETYKRAQEIRYDIIRLESDLSWIERASSVSCGCCDKEGLNCSRHSLNPDEVREGMRVYYQAKIAELEEQFAAL